MRRIVRCSIWVVMVASLALLDSTPVFAAEAERVADNVTMETVRIWSEGTRIAGDFYRPDGIATTSGGR